MSSIPIKLVVAGDADSQKTLFLSRYTKDKFPEDYEPIAFDNITIEVQVESQTVDLQLCDTSGQEEYEHLRRLSYTNSDIILILFSLDSKTSFCNALTKWFPEIRESNSETTISFIGVSNIPETLSQDGQITEDIGGELQNLNCFYRQCNLSSGKDLNDIVEEPIKSALQLKEKKRSKRTQKSSLGCQLI